MSSTPSWVTSRPANWRAVPFRHLYRRTKRIGYEHETLLSVYRDHGVVDKSSRSDNFNNASEDLGLYQLVDVGDLAINKMKAWQGSVAVSPIRGIVSPAYFVYAPTHHEHSGYLHYLLRSAEYTRLYQLYSKGIRVNQWDLDPSVHGSMPVLLPPLEEQRRIAEFLDRETAQIDELIVKQEQLISTLAERQAELRLRAVTQGLRDGVSLVESGVPWLGKSPEHWTIGGLGRRVRVTSGFPFKSDEFSDEENDWRLLRGINIGPQRIKWDETVYWARSDLDGLNDFELEVGDVVLGLDRPVVSDGVRVARLEDGDVPALLLQRVARVRPSHGLDVEFLVLLLSSRMFVDYLAPIFTGVSVPHMSPDQLKQFTVAFPPIAEQREIAAYVRSAERQTAELIHAARRFVETLQERRQALISAAVTRQIDVGGAS